MIKENEILTLEAIDIDYQGKGVCKLDDMVIFVKKMIIGEIALVKITSVKRNFATAEIVKLIKPSKERRNIEIPNFGSLSLIHLTDEAQVSWQEQITKHTFKKIAGLDIEINRSIVSPKTTYYRNKAVFHVLNNEHITLGLYQDDELKLKKINDFLLAAPLINRFLKIINESHIIVDDDIHHIVFRVNTRQEILITFVADTYDFYGLDNLIMLLRKFNEVAGITVNLKRDMREILSSDSKTVYKKDLLKMDLEDLVLSVNDRSFYQINTSVIDETYQAIKEEIKENDTVIDAYSGIGSIGFYLAKKAKKILLIDNNKENINMAEKTKQENNIQNIAIINGNVEDMLAKLKADVLIVDPPRNGLFPQTKETILMNNYQKLIYLSCDLKTLTRDISELTVKYEIKKVIPIRMFPQTISVETLVVLVLKN